MRARQRLQQFLKQADPLVAASSARLIALINDGASAPALVAHALESRAYSKTAALNALEDMGLHGQTDVVVMLRSLLDDPRVPNDHYWYGYKGVRAAAAVLLLKSGDCSGIEYLESLADKKDAVFRRWYAPALLCIEHSAADEIKSRLRLEDVWTLEEQRSLADIAFSDPAQLCLLCDALAVLDDDAVDPVLHHYAGFHSRFVRVQAARALIQRHGDDYRETVAELLSKQRTVFEQIAVAELWSDADALLALASSDADGFDRAAAIHALTQLNKPINASLFNDFVHDAHAFVRYAALEYGIMSDRPLPELQLQADDPLWDCRLAAWETRMQRELV